MKPEFIFKINVNNFEYDIWDRLKESTMNGLIESERNGYKNLIDSLEKVKHAIETNAKKDVLMTLTQELTYGVAGMYLPTAILKRKKTNLMLENEILMNFSEFVYARKFAIAKLR